ncbi:DUF5677 domain-containing protein [Bacillus mycoides]|uniref:DUF5677 domain-containing protein n=1 Tax=Bacillus mycoides TaxID=1405 RepID=UPI00065B48DC|nr:DUF5677 domain-containing protein [Bacillus mycoides]KMQ14019.1 hypothetical protein TU70_25800 [Bacillus mycoides]
METQLFLVQQSEKFVQKVYADLSEEYETLPHEQTIILAVFRRILEKVDAVNVLVEKQCGKVIESLAREVLESYWHLCYLLEDDTNFRTLSYYYFDKMGKAKSILTHTQHLKKIKPELECDTEIKKCEEMIEYLNNDSYFEEIRKEIENKGNPNPKWYSLKNKISNLSKLAEHLNFEDEYNTTYNLLSKEVHGLTSTGHIKMENEQTVIRPLRNMGEGEGILMFCHVYLSYSLGKFVQYFRLDSEFAELQREMYKRIQAEN